MSRNLVSECIITHLFFVFGGIIIIGSLWVFFNVIISTWIIIKTIFHGMTFNRSLNFSVKQFSFTFHELAKSRLKV